jgi:predicted kinase
MKNILQHLYTGGQYSTEINWDFLETIPEFAVLKDCEQNPKWHSEGNVLNHTKLALEKLNTEVLDMDLYYSLSDDELLMLRATVVLHDIGKGVTTSLGKDGNWHAYGHEFEGEKIARVLLWNEDIHVRETICSLIKFHMEPLRLFESKNWLNKMIEIGCRIPWKYLWIVKMADLLGSVQINGGTMKDDLMKMELIKETAQALGIWEGKNRDKFKNIAKYSDRAALPWKVSYSPEKVAYIMIGLPGAGKNTFINKNVPKDAIQISRDDIRVELGFCKPDEKYLGTPEEENRVTVLYDEKLSNAISLNKKIVLNNVHLKKKYRDVSVNLLRKNGYKIIYVYVEAPTLDINYNRRDGQISPNIIKGMALSFEWPDVTEYDELIIDKQTW